MAAPNPVADIFRAHRALYAEKNEQADTVVVSPELYDTLRSCLEVRYNAETGAAFLDGLTVRTSPFAKGIAFFRGDKLLRVVQ